MDVIERKLQRQIWLCIFNALGYAAWQGSELTYFVDEPAARGVSAIGAILWTVTLAFILWPLLRARMRKSAVGGDERVARNGFRATMVAYWLLMLAVGILFPVSLLMQVAAIDVARIFAIVGVAGPVFAFAVLEAVDGRE